MSRYVHMRALLDHLVSVDHMNYNVFGHIGLLIPENLSNSDNYSHKEVRAAARHANQMKDPNQLVSALYGPASYTTWSNSL